MAAGCVCYCLRVVRWNGGRGFSWTCTERTFSTLLTTAEEDDTGFMALCAERMRRPSSWHPIWIQKVLHMAFICVGMCFRIGSKTTNIKKHLLLWCEGRACSCVCLRSLCLFVRVEMTGCDFVPGVTRRLAAHNRYDKVTNVGWVFLTERMRDERHQRANNLNSSVPGPRHVSGGTSVTMIAINPAATSAHTHTHTLLHSLVASLCLRQ